MINQPNTVSAAVAPRCLVLCNGETLQGWVSAAVDNSSSFQADTFHLTLALSAQPSNRGMNFWASLEKAEIEILFGFPRDPMSFDKSELTSFVVGNVDDIEIDPVADTITLAGRDLSSLLIDARQTLSHVSYKQKASDIITTIANQVGLTPVVTATVSPVGVYQDIVHALHEQKCTYWDLACKLAQIEGYAVYVKGYELHFEPRALPTADPYVIRYNTQATSGAFALNAMRLVFTRNLSIAKDMVVDVVSYNAKTGKVAKGHAERIRVYNNVTKGVAKLDSTPLKYFLSAPNLDAAGAKRLADQVLQDRSSHEMNLTADLPGDVLLTPQSIIRVEGTNTPFDQVFYAMSIQRTFSYDEGFRMSVSAKNQTPNNPT